MTGTSDRGTASSLRGWLSEVYFPALVSDETSQLALRLGERATLDDPLFGRVTGGEVAPRLRAISDWLRARSASFEKLGFVMGSDRDVTEGTLALELGGSRRVEVPVAVVAERRKEREVELRTYYTTRGLAEAPHPERSPMAAEDAVLVPPPVEAHLDALARADAAAVAASFELGGAVRTPAGVSHVKAEGGGPLQAYYAELLRTRHGQPGALEARKTARADDGSTCALEYTVVRLRGEAVPPLSGLAVYERGESGLLRSLRVYDEVG